MALHTLLTRSHVHGLARAAVVTGAVLLGGVAAAEEPVARVAPEPWHDFIETYRFGITELETDDYTKVTGWQLGHSWHFGYKEGKGSGLALVWQGERDQMSISTDGVRFTRRF